MILFLIDHNKPGTWDLGPRSRPLRISAEWKWEPKKEKRTIKIRAANGNR